MVVKHAQAVDTANVGNLRLCSNCGDVTTRLGGLCHRCSNPHTVVQEWSNNM